MDEIKKTTEREMIEYRLDKIDTALEELKEIVIESKLQRNDINLLKEEIDELQTSTNKRLDKHSNQIDTLCINLNSLNNSFETKDLKKDAGKWRYVMDYVFKLIITGIISGKVLGWF